MTLNWHLIDVGILNLFMFLPVDDSGKHPGSQLTVDDLFQRDFQVHDPDARWISGKYIKGL